MSDYTVISIEPHEQVLLVIVTASRLDARTASQLEDEVSRATLDTPTVPVVLDMSAVRFAPSVALGALVNLFKGLRLTNRKAFIIGVNRQIRGTLAVTRLNTLINVRASLADALSQI